MIIRIRHYEDEDINIKRIDDTNIPDELIKINLENDILLCSKYDDYIEIDEYFNIFIKAGNTYDLFNDVFNLPIKIMTPLIIEPFFSSTIPCKPIFDWFTDIRYGYILKEHFISDNLVVADTKNLKYKLYNGFTIYTQNINKSVILKKFDGLPQINSNYNLFKVIFYPIYTGVNTNIQPNIFVISSKYIFERLPDF